jgi:hypothetical protein
VKGAEVSDSPRTPATSQDGSEQDAAPPVVAGPPEVYRNEFAMVEVTRYETETGPRLCIRDLSSGNEIFLDPVELEGLTRLRHADFAPLVDPSERVSAPEPDPDQV